MKKILIILIVLLLLGGGGGGYYYYFIILPEQEAAAEPAAPPPPDKRFIELNALRIPVMRNGAVINYVSIDVSLEVVGPDNEELARSLLPRVRNAFLTDLLGYFAVVPVEDSILVKAIKRRLLILCNRVLGNGVVDDVLIQNAFKQS